MMGGGMRQAGIIAAGALFALHNHRHRLAEDHANARLLGMGLARIKGLEVDPSEVETNMVRFRVKTMPTDRLVEQLRNRGVLVLMVGPDTIRAVTSLMVSKEDIQSAVAAVSELVEGVTAKRAKDGNYHEKHRRPKS
jgi:threonine aldolase